MKKYLFAVVLILATIMGYCQDNTHIIMDYEGSLRIYTLLIHRNTMTTGEVGISCGSDHDPGVYHAVSELQYDMLKKFIIGYIVPERQISVDSAKSKNTYTYHIYISLGYSPIYELKLLGWRQTQHFFERLAALLDKEKMNAGLSSYIYKDILKKD